MIFDQNLFQSENLSKAFVQNLKRGKGATRNVLDCWIYPNILNCWSVPRQGCFGGSHDNPKCCLDKWCRLTQGPCQSEDHSKLCILVGHCKDRFSGFMSESVSQQDSLWVKTAFGHWHSLWAIPSWYCDGIGRSSFGNSSRSFPTGSTGGATLSLNCVDFGEDPIFLPDEAKRHRKMDRAPNGLM